MKLISAHDVSVFRDVLQNIGQTSGRILLEIESEVPLSKKEEKKESKHISFNVYLTDNIPLYFQTSILDTNNIKGKVMLKIEIIYQADLPFNNYTYGYKFEWRKRGTNLRKSFFFYNLRGLSCVTQLL